jgi:hypothetical protein
MSDGRPLSSEIRDGLQALRELREMANISPFGPLLAIDTKIHDIELLLHHILRDISACSR